MTLESPSLCPELHAAVGDVNLHVKKFPAHQPGLQHPLATGTTGTRCHAGVSRKPPGPCLVLASAPRPCRPGEKQLRVTQGEGSAAADGAGGWEGKGRSAGCPCSHLTALLQPQERPFKARQSWGC